MDEALKLQEQHEELRARIIKAICDYEKKHADIEMAVDFDENEEIVWQPSFDEQLEGEYIRSVENGQAIIYHDGEKIGHEPLGKLTTEMLVELVVSIGISYDRVKGE